jgi:magnesium transporter
MLRFHSTIAKGEVKVGLDATALPAGVNWIDAMRPEAKEVAFLDRILGVKVPTLENLSAIETSSRLYRDKDLLYMSMPMMVRSTSGVAQTSPLGFVLTKDYVLTVRYMPIKSCEDLHYADVVENGRPANGPSALISLLETIIDHSSDELEKINADLDSLSQVVFDQGGGKPRQGPIEDTKNLRRVLGALAGGGTLASKTSDALLGMSRMLPYVTTEAASYLSPGEKAKIKSLTRDISSLNEYERSQTDRIQFLLDATLGLTNIEQNNIFRILTVVSVVGIPPTLVASMYGMNFKNMPELEWTYGYEWGLGLILLSALIPIIWFKRRGWW